MEPWDAHTILTCYLLTQWLNQTREFRRFRWSDFFVKSDRNPAKLPRALKQLKARDQWRNIKLVIGFLLLVPIAGSLSFFTEITWSQFRVIQSYMSFGTGTVVVHSHFLLLRAQACRSLPNDCFKGCAFVADVGISGISECTVYKTSDCKLIKSRRSITHTCIPYHSWSQAFSRNAERTLYYIQRFSPDWYSRD